MPGVPAPWAPVELVPSGRWSCLERPEAPASPRLKRAAPFAGRRLPSALRTQQAWAKASWPQPQQLRLRRWSRHSLKSPALFTASERRAAQSRGRGVALLWPWSPAGLGRYSSAAAGRCSPWPPPPKVSSATRPPPAVGSGTRDAPPAPRLHLGWREQRRASARRPRIDPSQSATQPALLRAKPKGDRSPGPPRPALFGTILAPRFRCLPAAIFPRSAPACFLQPKEPRSAGSLLPSRPCRRLRQVQPQGRPRAADSSSSCFGRLFADILAALQRCPSLRSGQWPRGVQRVGPSTESPPLCLPPLQWPRFARASWSGRGERCT